MSDIILPSKLVSERITVSFDFRDELEWGETIVSANCTVSVLTGTDGSPQDLLYLPVVISTSGVSQQVWMGLPGVIYTISMAVTGSTGQVYEKFARLAILPSSAKPPPYSSNLLTSTPYPVESIDAVGSTSDYIRSQFYKTTIEGVTSASDIVSGWIRQILIQYEYDPEGVDSTSTIVGGDLYAVLKTYEIPPEGVNSTSIIVSGLLDMILITYTHPAEGVTSTSDIVSGTLT